MLKKSVFKIPEGQNSGKIPLVLMDTNVLVAGLCRRKNSPSYRILKNIQEGKIPLALTQKLFLEYEMVLNRKPIRELINATPGEVKLILEALLVIAQKSEVFYLWRPNLLDESDNFVLESAIATGAIIVTKNITDFKSGDLKFTDVVILTPQQFCEIYL